MITIELEEFQRTAIDPALLLRDGLLNLYPELEGQDLFDLQITPHAVLLQARGWIGTIPLNDDLAIHVVPRVPIANLARLMEISECVPKRLTRAIRNYQRAGPIYPALVTMYADALGRGIEDIWRQGLLKEYQRREAVTSMPHGRILVGRSLIAAASTGQHHRAYHSWYQRSVDNPSNRCLLFAVYRLHALAQRLAHSLPQADTRRISATLNRCTHHLSGVDVDLAQDFLRDPVVQGTWPLPTVRDYYRSVLDLALTIIGGQGVVITDTGGTLRLPSLLVNMSDVFESYLRNSLRHTAGAEGWAAQILDGNKAPGRKSLFDSGSHIPAKPDVVVRVNDRSNQVIDPVVVEVKYRPARSLPKREDLDQALVYGMSYRANHVLIVQPRAGSGILHGLREIGTVRGLRVWSYVYDTSATDLSKEEASFARTIASLTESARAGTATQVSFSTS